MIFAYDYVADAFLLNKASRELRIPPVEYSHILYNLASIQDDVYMLRAHC